MTIRVETETDFFIIFPPMCKEYRRVLAYHEAFREKIEEISPLHWHDNILFPRYQIYYEKLAALLFPSDLTASQLTIASRHSFFVTEGIDKDNRIQLSGLQKLLGFQVSEESDPPESSSVTQITTGEPYLDILGSLILLELKNIPWLLANYSLNDLVNLSHYLWQQKAIALGQTPDNISEQDHETWSKLVNDDEIDQARKEAQQSLLLRHGPAAIEMARLKEQSLKEQSQDETS
jgi:hypothetical protein